jgi:hypothetical protein
MSSEKVPIGLPTAPDQLPGAYADLPKTVI